MLNEIIKPELVAEVRYIPVVSTVITVARVTAIPNRASTSALVNFEGLRNLIRYSITPAKINLMAIMPQRLANVVSSFEAR